MRVAIRADASLRIGTGHVMRCLTLAEALCLRGCEVAFLCRRHPGHLMEFLKSKGFHVLDLGEPLPDESLAEGYARWLGSSEAEDAAAAHAALGSGPWGCIVVDHYGLGAAWEERIRSSAQRVLAIDDLAERPHACDLLLDQNRPESFSGYAALCPPGCRTLLGPSYALLRREFLEEREACAPQSERPDRVFVFYGGVDDTRETEKAIEALARLGFSGQVDVVAGRTNPRAESLREMTQRLPLGVFHHGADRISSLMGLSGLALGAGGTTTWERACVGLPSLITATAENQFAIGAEAERLGFACYLGPWSQVGPESLAQAIRSALADSSWLQAASVRGKQCVDGLGASRLADLLLSGAES